MPIFQPIEENEAKGKVKEIYEDIKNKRNVTEVPNFWKSIANNPETLERTWSSLQQVMKKGTLDPVIKELIYVAVSVTNGCEYCIKSHSLAAKKKGATNDMISEMIAVVGMAKTFVLNVLKLELLILFFKSLVFLNTEAIFA